MVKGRMFAICGAVGLLLPVWGQRSGGEMRFEVVSIRQTAANAGPGAIQWGLPDGFRQKGQPLRRTIMLAYFPVATFNKNWLVNEPGWMEDELYDVDAKVGEPDALAWVRETKSADKPMLQAMLQRALAERCKLVAHKAMVDGPVWSLVVRKKGGLRESPAGEEPPSTAVHTLSGGWMVPIQDGGPEEVSYYGTTMAQLAADLTMHNMGRPIVDQTGLTGRYDFVVKRRAPDPGDADNPDPMPMWDVDGIGLEFKAAKGKVERLVIEHVERPTEN